MNIGYLNSIIILKLLYMYRNYLVIKANTKKSAIKPFYNSNMPNVMSGKLHVIGLHKKFNGQNLRKL